MRPFNLGESIAKSTPKNILNFAFNLGESIAKSKIVRKILGSLPERFYAKITDFD